MQPPETRTTTHEIRETILSTTSVQSDNDEKEVEDNEYGSTGIAANERDDDLV